MKKQVWITFIILTGLALTACGPTYTRPQAQSIGPRSWFDAPLPNTVCYPPSPCDLVAHGSDPGGIAKFELSVNGAAAATIPSPNTSQSLVTLNYKWNPPGPGTYNLTLRSQDNQGKWSGEASTVVVVEPATTTKPASGGIVQGVVYADLNGDGNIGPNEGPLSGVTVDLSGCGSPLSQVTAADGKFNFTNLPAGSCQVQVSKSGWAFSGSYPKLSYPIPAASDPNLPTAFSIYMTRVENALVAVTPTPTASSGNLSVTSVSTNAVYYGASNCGPQTVTIQAQADDPAGIADVELFFRISSNSGQATNYNSQSMKLESGSIYQTTVNPESSFGRTTLSRLGDGYFEYQVVVQDNNGSTSLRTSVFSNVTIAGCGGGAPASVSTPTLIYIKPFIIYTLTPTPYILR